MCVFLFVLCLFEVFYFCFLMVGEGEGAGVYTSYIEETL